MKLNIARTGWPIALAASIAILGLVGCASAPTAVERKFFDIETNLVARPVFVTNVVPSYVTNTVVSYETNRVSDSEVAVVPVTNATVTVSYQTNRTVAPTYETEIVLKPNTNSGLAADVVGRTAGLFFPAGELVSVLVGAALGIWGWLRSKRAGKTAGVLAQIIETGRQVLQSTPQGRALDDEWKAWMIQHQAEQGVILDVMRLLQGTVDDSGAKDAAARLAKKLRVES